MPTILNASFSDKEKVKALGARWDSANRTWYVPDGLQLEPFAQWIPGAPSAAPAVMTQRHLAGAGTDLAPAAPQKGITLSSLMSGVAQAVAQAYRAGVWTQVEVVKLDIRSGHIYLELSERDPSGQVQAQARAVIWKGDAAKVVAPFEKATGVVLGAGIKLLVRAKPQMHALYGISLVIDAIDPEYTLGDLEGKKREIRERLRGEGVYELNKALEAPWDFNKVLVVAPEAAAGLGDFQAESGRLQKLGICHFHYVHSRFQGEGAAAEILRATLKGIDGHNKDQDLDAVVIIRGGGAVNDLAWLNDYELARMICDLRIPVFTGIGHERDNTLLDEVAHTRFDTPSKVILGIEARIRARCQDAAGNYADITKAAVRAANDALRSIDLTQASVKSEARQHLARAQLASTADMATIRLEAAKTIQDAASNAKHAYIDVSHGAHQQIELAKRETPAIFASLVERAGRTMKSEEQSAGRLIADIRSNARSTLAAAKTNTDALIREVIGQGPEKTLARGFSLARTDTGNAITSAAQATKAKSFQIRFHDGHVATQIKIRGKK